MPMTAAQRMSKYRAKNPDKNREVHMKYYANNKEKETLRVKKYYYFKKECKRLMAILL
jgi:hypothetical protein